jgi:hypothetical protein
MQLTLQDLANIAQIVGIFLAIATALWFVRHVHAVMVGTFGIILAVMLLVSFQNLPFAFIASTIIWLALFTTWTRTKTLNLIQKFISFTLVLCLSIILLIIWELGWFIKNLYTPIWVFLLIGIISAAITYFVSKPKIFSKGVSYRFKFRGGQLEPFIERLSSYAELKEKRWRAIGNNEWNLELTFVKQIPVNDFRSELKNYDVELLCIGYLTNISEDGFI